MMKNNTRNVIVVVQSRLGSTRLPQKGLLPLGSKPVIAHVLSVMRQVPAAQYYLATDESSFTHLAPVAEQCGFVPFAGSAEDVLDRFCCVVEKFQKDYGYLPEIIVRATGDNPFLFGTAACASVDLYYTDSEISGQKTSYFTFTGLPHGSGIEILHVESLLKARTLTSDPYDHEHVGPSLYRHQDVFHCIFKPAPACWNHPELRTTIDTPGDYQRAKRLYQYLQDKEGTDGPFEDQAVVSAFDVPFIAKPVLLIPSVTKEHGTGHFRRCAQIAEELQADMYVGAEPLSKEFINVLDEYTLAPWQVLQYLPDEKQLKNEPGYVYHLVVLDQFITDTELGMYASRLGPVVAIDEGASSTAFAQYLLDIIPAVDASRTVNAVRPDCIPLPVNRKTVRPESIHTALISIGGQDPAGLTTAFADEARKAGLEVTVITKDNPVSNLKEQLASYDLVITHYGFTAFESLAAGCAVILVGTTPLHVSLAEKYGFSCLTDAEKLHQLLRTPEKLFNPEFTASYLSESASLSDTIRNLSFGVHRSCPVCGKNHDFSTDPVQFRGIDRTFRKCSECGIQYLSWSQNKESDYGADYFFDDYKKQYGKTYLEDFDAIKAQGLERSRIIMDCISADGRRTAEPPRILDIGCAYGPFLAAAAETGFLPEGIDINAEAIAYVKNTLGFPARVQAFPGTAPEDVITGPFDAVTMWYVIEHLADLKTALTVCNELLSVGGVFAFSTPDFDGVTGTYFPEKFYRQSPIDHLTLWNHADCATVLERFGFSVVKVVSTGHHPERFPGAEKCRAGSLKFRYLMRKSQKKFLGDTCQIYCVKTRGIEK